MCNRRLLSSLLVVGALGTCTVNQARADTFEVKGVKIYYTIEGKGQPVVLIHGLLATGLLNWKLPGIVEELAKDHQVIVLDLPGHGKSGKPENKEAYGVQMAEDVVLLLDHLKIAKAHLVGYSLGGMITMKLLALHPERIRSAAVCGMGWFQEGSNFDKIWAKAGETRKKLPVGPPPAFYESIDSLALSKKELKKIDLPVKVFVGDRDFIKPLTVAPLKKARPDWPVVEIEDADHITCVINPHFRDELAAWLRKNSK